MTNDATRANNVARANPIDLGKIVSSAAEWETNKRHQIKIYCDAIAMVMEELHGGSYRVQIEHDVGLIVVAKRIHESAKPILPGDLREAV